MKTSLSILHTESSLGWGGQENRTLNEMITMKTMGHECTLACQPGARLGQKARDAGFSVHEVRMRGALDVPAIYSIRQLIKRIAAQVVNTHSSKDTLIAGFACRSFFGKRPALVRTRHLALPITSTFTYSTLPDHVVTVSEFVGKYLISAGVPNRMITVIPTGIDLSRYTSHPDNGTLKVELGIPQSATLIGTVAILRRKKGHSELLDAIPAVLNKYPETYFVFAGDGPQTDALSEQIRLLGIGHRVFMLGLRSDVINILQSLDIFVLPTHQEALGTAFIEAGAMGLPCIGTNVDGVPEVVVDGITGILVKPESSPSISAALLKLIENPDSRRQMGASAKIYVNQKFSLRSMCENMESLYKSLVVSP